MVKKTYYYFFYKIFKSIEYTSKEFGGEFMIDFKTSLVLITLEIFIIFSFANYYNIFFHSDSGIFPNSIWVIIILILTMIDYFIFHSKKQWKNIINNFDKLTENENNRGSWIVFVTIALVLINFVFSFYLYYQS